MTKDEMRARREKLQREVASILDHPSVYMGGPSRQSLQNADRILAHLEKVGALHPALNRNWIPGGEPIGSPPVRPAAP